MSPLSNSCLQFTVNPEQFSFNLTSNQFPGAKIENAQFGLELGRSKILNFELKNVQEDSLVESIHGQLQALTLNYLEPKTGILLDVDFRMSFDLPFLFQRMRLHNNSNITIQPKRFLFSNVQPGSIHFSSKKPTKTAFYSNGWQSWSPSGTWQYGQRQTRSKLVGFSYPMLYDAGTPITRSKNHFSSDMFAALLDHDAQTGLICGFISQKEQLGSLTSTLHPEPDLQVWANCDEIELAPGKTLESDWLAWQFFDMGGSQPFSEYFEAATKENQVKERMKSPTGWCSWYYYFKNITPQILQQNLEAVQQSQPQLPLDVFQIDDGFQQDVGTWLTFNQKFPKGVKELSNQIHKAGLESGLWLAPFIVERQSELNEEHPEWILQNKSGKPVNSGFVWDHFGRALDLTHPEVQNYVRKVISTAVRDWGYPYLKLDFLYAAALPGRHHDPSLTRAQILRKGLELIREAAGESTTLLGCGCPIGPGIGIFDMMRISADVSPDWKPEVYGMKFPFKNEPNMPCARNAIQNILTRSIMEPHLWVNDPDCLLVRDDSNLSQAEVQSLATAISLTGGAILISDDMTHLNPKRLKLAASLLPVLPPNPVVPDLFANYMPTRLGQTLKNCSGEWKVIALFNWQDKPTDLILELSDWGLENQQQLMREFWSGEIALTEKQHTFKQVPAHGVRLVAVRKNTPITYLGSDMHVSQGVELKEWQLEDSVLKFRLNLDRIVEGNCYLRVPSLPSRILVNSKSIEWLSLNENIIQIPVSLQPDCLVQIDF